MTTRRNSDDPNAPDAASTPSTSEHVDFDAMVENLDELDLDLDGDDGDEDDDDEDDNDWEHPEELIIMAGTRLPDATPAGGEVATEEAIAALCKELDPDGTELAEFLDGAATFDIGELVGPPGRLELRCVAFVEEDDLLITYLVMRQGDSAEVLASSFMVDVDPDLSSPQDRLRLASLLLDGLSHIMDDGLRLSLAPSFGFLARPFGTIQIGENLKPEDRTAARAQRTKQRKRGR